MDKNGINILMVAVKYEAGGAPRSMKEMILNLKNTYGVNVTVAVCNDELIAEWCRNNRIQYVVSGHDTFLCVKEEGIKQFIKRFLRIPLVYLRNKKALKTVEQQIDLNSIDIIHTNSNRDNFGALISRKYNIPHVWHLREYGKQDYDTRFLFPFSISFMNKSTTRFIAISNGVKQAWINRGINKHKILRIYNGVDVSSIQKKDGFCKEGILKIVFTGSLFSFKGQIELIEAISKLDKSIQNNILVDFYYEGIDENYEILLKNKISEYGLNECFRFCGPTNSIKTILKNYDVGIICSKSEAFGRVTVEYMAAGLITIASNTGANPEIIDDCENGFIYKYGDYDDFSRILKKVYNLSSQQKSHIGNEAINKVERAFTDNINAKNVYELYQSILSE